MQRHERLPRISMWRVIKTRNWLQYGVQNHKTEHFCVGIECRHEDQLFQSEDLLD